MLAAAPPWRHDARRGNGHGRIAHARRIVYKTFTAPQPTVRKATMTALNRMQIQVTKTKRTGSSERSPARGDRDVEIELESLTRTRRA